MTEFVGNSDAILGSLIVLCIMMVFYITYLQSIMQHFVHLLQGIADGYVIVTKNDKGRVHLKINEGET